MSTDTDSPPLNDQRVTVMDQTIEGRRGDHAVAEHQCAPVLIIVAVD